MSVLSKIIERKRERLRAAIAARPLAEIRESARQAGGTRDFLNAVRMGNGRIRLIAEVKKASPSRGIIREDFDPAGIASIYEQESADAVSVLTEEDFFMGSLGYIPLIKGITSIPVLRKDFIIDEYQIYEARASGADAILLIASVLGIKQAEDYLSLCRDLGLAVLFEVHDYEELDIALRLDADIIGINNRNLKTMNIDLNTTFVLKKHIPDGKVVVSESGIKSRRDVISLQDAGIDAMLVGTAFMESQDIRVKVRELCGK